MLQGTSSAAALCSLEKEVLCYEGWLCSAEDMPKMLLRRSVAGRSPLGWSRPHRPAPRQLSGTSKLSTFPTLPEGRGWRGPHPSCLSHYLSLVDAGLLVLRSSCSCGWECAKPLFATWIPCHGVPLSLRAVRNSALSVLLGGLASAGRGGQCDNLTLRTLPCP